jgi:signal transduction histidine kinase/CheY-like chemotaxis protein
MAHGKTTAEACTREDGAHVRSSMPMSVLRAAIDRDHDAVCYLDRSFRVIAGNAAWVALMGIGEDAIGRTLMELFGTALPLIEQGFGPALGGREVIKTFRSTNGDLNQIVIAPWRDADGAIGGVMCRQPPGRQPSSEGHDRRLKLAMEMAKIVAYEVDFRTGETTYEPAHPLPLKNVRFHSFEDTVAHLPEAERQRALKGWKNHLSTGTLMARDYARPNPNGGVLWQRTVAEAVRDVEGNVAGLVGVSQMIDDQKQAELALVAEKEVAQAANRAKSEFLANMSHEIRTPLTSVIGFADLLLKLEGLPPSAETCVQRIANAGHSLLSVINDVLDFSKLEAGQVELDPHPFEPAVRIQEVVDLLATQAAIKGLELDLEFAPDVPAWVEADSTRISQVLINLIGNAIKFTEAGRVSVSVTYQRDGLGQLYVSVADTGVGITEDVRDRLFQRFSQVDGSVTRRYGGTGLGLAICKSLVDLMGGTLGFESEADRGSTFSFSVPARLTTPAVADLACENEGLSMRPVHILLVDDVAANRQLVRAMLTPLGHTFEEAENGVEAVNVAMNSRFDLILMDLQMPEMDGMAATRLIRADDGPNRCTPILAFSANVMTEHTEAANAAGMNDHIAKPIRPLELVTKVALWTSDFGPPPIAEPLSAA